MKSYGAIVALTLGAGMVLMGCSMNDCSAGSVCGDSNAVGAKATEDSEKEGDAPLGPGWSHLGANTRPSRQTSPSFGSTCRGRADGL